MEYVIINNVLAVNAVDIVGRITKIPDNNSYSITILNQPWQSGGPPEGNWHLNAKVSVAKVLSDAGYTISYEKDIISWDGSYTFHVDIFVENHDIVVECDGIKNHGSKIKKAKDRWRTSELEKVGLKVIRITVTEAIGAPEQIVPMVDRLTGRNKKNRLF